MAWFYLLIAGACEMVWPLGFKYTHGFKEKHWAVGITFAVMGLSLWLMSQATVDRPEAKGVPIGTAYAVWTGLGAAGTAVLGIIIFAESRDWMRLTCLTLIIAGAIGLKFLTPSAPPASPEQTAPAVQGAAATENVDEAG